MMQVFRVGSRPVMGTCTKPPPKLLLGVLWWLFALGLHGRLHLAKSGCCGATRQQRCAEKGSHLAAVPCAITPDAQMIRFVAAEGSLLATAPGGDAQSLSRAEPKQVF